MAYIGNIRFELKKTKVDGFEMPFKRYDGIDFNFWTFVPENIEEHLKGLKNLEVREDDVFICTHPRSGTNWTHEIVKMITSGSATYYKHVLEGLDVTPTEKIVQLESPRTLVSHFPYKFLPHQLAEKGKVICVFRNPADIAVSFYHFLKNASFADFDGTFSDFLKIFMDGNLPGGSWFDYVKGWEKVINENTKNPILALYYEDMKRDLQGHVKKIAKYLNVPYTEKLIMEITDKCGSNKMIPEKKANVPDVVANSLSKDGKTNLLYRKGEIGDWKNYFTVAEKEEFDIIFTDRMKDSKLKIRYS